MGEKKQGQRGPAKKPVGEQRPAKTPKGNKKSPLKAKDEKGKGRAEKHLVKVFAQKSLVIKPKSVIPEEIRSVKKEGDEILTIVPDTNIIMHHLDALFKFDEHKVVICGQVWKELDVEKSMKGTEAGRNVRASVRYLSDLVKGKTKKELEEGLTLEPPEHLKNGRIHTGKIYWDFSKPNEKLIEGTNIDIDINIPDHRILLSCLKLMADNEKVVLVTSDLNFRVFAAHAGVTAEKYFSDEVEALPSVGESVTTGFHTMPEDFWDKIGKNCSSNNEGGVFVYKFNHAMFKHVYCNQFLVLPDDVLLRVTEKESSHKITAKTMHHHNYDKVLLPRNMEQSIGLELLMDYDLPCVVLDGPAGSGKTFMVMAFALAAKEAGMYDKIIITRALADVDKDIGFLPGTEEEKMSPWLAAFTDNLEVLVGSDGRQDDHSKEASHFASMTLNYAIEKYNIQFRSLNYMRGRSFTRTLIINDESQNAKPLQMKTLTTRVGLGSKIVHLGNVSQIDNEYLTPNTCGLADFLRKSTESPLVGNVTLQGVVRSPIAEWAEGNL